MQVKVTHKLAPPHVVQEATGEVLAIGFHEQESFGLPETNAATWSNAA